MKVDDIELELNESWFNWTRAELKLIKVDLIDLKLITLH